jgi:hypothetical protein
MFCVAVAGCASALRQSRPRPSHVGAEARADLVAQALAYEQAKALPRTTQAAALYCEAARRRSGSAIQPGMDVCEWSRFRATMRSPHRSSRWPQLPPRARPALGFVGDRAALPGCFHRLDPTPATDARCPADPFAELPDGKGRSRMRSRCAALRRDTRLAWRLSLSNRTRAGLHEGCEGIDATHSRNGEPLQCQDPSTSATMCAEVSPTCAGCSPTTKAISPRCRRVQRRRGRRRLPGIPPYPETREYVRRVLSLYGNTQHPYDPRIVKPASFLPASDKPL